MNILGEGFPDEIIKQVEQRQKVYGSGYNSLNPRTSEEIVYLNANTSWVKLASSVNIDDPKIIQDKSLSKLGEDITGNKLAKKFVLFNGTDDYSEKLRSGIALNKDLLGNNNAYGIGGTEFGLRPMMGIKSADIKHENRGSIRRASIQIKAFNKAQFDIIDVLYLRLGFNVLLEWGHSMYYSNGVNGSLQKDGIGSSLANYFLDGTRKGPYKSNVLTYDVFLDMIRQQRLESNGNYDAMFAKVCNFHWSFLPDGSYDITLDLVSIGDVVESFKINLLTNGPTVSINQTDENKEVGDRSPSQIIDLYANQSSIGQYFYSLKAGTTSTQEYKTTSETYKAEVKFQKEVAQSQRIGFGGLD
jgi:hypothetical protein